MSENNKQAKNIRENDNSNLQIPKISTGSIMIPME